MKRKATVNNLSTMSFLAPKWSDRSAGVGLVCFLLLLNGALLQRPAEAETHRRATASSF